MFISQLNLAPPVLLTFHLPPSPLRFWPLRPGMTMASVTRINWPPPWGPLSSGYPGFHFPTAGVPFLGEFENGEQWEGRGRCREDSGGWAQRRGWVDRKSHAAGHSWTQAGAVSTWDTGYHWTKVRWRGRHLSAVKSKLIPERALPRRRGG